MISLFCKSSPVFAELQAEGHTFNYSCGKFDGEEEEKGSSPRSQYDDQCNTEDILLKKMTSYSPIFNRALRGIFNNYLQICIMNEEQRVYFKTLVLQPPNPVR